MTKLKTLLFRSLPNAAHFNFCTEVSLELATSPSTVTSPLGQLIPQFNGFLNEEKSLMEWIKKDVLTKKIEDADYRLDHALTAIRAMARAQEYSLVQNIAEAAQRVYVMLMGYGDVSKRPYEEEEGDIRAILNQLNGAYVGDVSTLGLSPQVNELQAAFTAFEQLLTQRDDKSLKKPERTFREVRRDIEKVYHQVETIVNAGAIIGTATAAFITFINHLNPEIERLNGEFHRVRHDISDAQPEQIQPQTYTGRPLTPVPKVLYVTKSDGTIQLELGRDFDVSYYDNIEVGVARCMIHGKGAYKGSKTVTFVIQRTL